MLLDVLQKNAELVQLAVIRVLTARELSDFLVPSEMGVLFVKLQTIKYGKNDRCYSGRRNT